MSFRACVSAFTFMFFACSAAYGQSAPAAKDFQAANGYFSCEVPGQGWEEQADPEMDPEYHEYNLSLVRSAAEGAVMIDVTYYAPESDSFTGPEDFIERNTRNVLGETKNARETYGQAEPVEDHDLKAFRFERQRKVFVHPESKSDETSDLKEKIYVIPGETGFFVLHYSTPAAAYEQDLPVFEKIFSSFKPGKLGLKCDH